MQRLIGENQQEALTHTLWEQWKSYGYTTLPRALTWMDINNLAGTFLKLCREKQLDSREFDFSNLIDHTLNYEENKSTLYETVGNPYSEEEKEAANKLKDYLTEEELKNYSDQQKSILEQTTEKNQRLEKKVKKLSTEQEKQTVDIKKGLEQNKVLLDAIMARLETLPNLEKQIEAMKESVSFKDLGEALSPVIIAKKPEETRPLSPQVKAIAKEQKKQRTSLSESLGGLFAFLPGGNNQTLEPQPEKIDNPLICKYCGGKLKPQWTRCANCGAAIKPSATFKIPDYFKPQHKIKPLDAFAGIFTLVIWVAATGWIIQSFSLGYSTIIGLAVFWIFFVVAFRLMIGGILD